MSPETLSPDTTSWSGCSAAEVAARLGVDPANGLSAAEVVARRAEHGANRLVRPPERPRWLQFVDQFRSGIVVLLAVAAVVAGAVGDWKDTVVIAVVLLINAVLGYVQEARAASALAALEAMLVTTVRVRRDGRLAEVSIDELVPGDVVLLDAGDRVPADGRLVQAVGLAIDESALTGESAPVDKWAEALADLDPRAGGAASGFADRANLAYLNTVVTRGRGELLVTATGMRTEIGRVAELLAEAEPGPTPLERQLDQLTTRLAVIACAAVALVFVLEVVQGQAVAAAALGAVALAVAAIPEGLPAVVTVTLAVGVSQMARRQAIVRRLHSVETLGSTTVVCSDKTGTLTLNQMTARRVVRGGRVIEVPGTGYRVEPPLPVASTEIPDLRDALEVAALCNDAAVRDGQLVGDPTEGALVVLAAKGGVDVDALRQASPRTGEVPFDSATKYMATFHQIGDELVCLVKGAPDRLLERCRATVGPGGDPVELDRAGVAALLAANDELAADGLRVLALASRRLDPTTVERTTDGSVAHPDQLVDQLTLEALVGIVDPPRDEARVAISRAHGAGIAVKMITGDHATTAAAIAGWLGIDGEVVSGEELDELSDDELAGRIDGIAVCARVSPEHKVRVVRALQAKGHVAAMTGDGVNDAAALRTADIGVAMGVTGTEVTKEAADMVLADDNFATIVEAVERGRTIYANIVTFVRFQVSTNLGAIGTILGASLVGLPVPFSPIQVLWVNLIADGPPALTLGVDPPDGQAMARPPRSPSAPILGSRRVARLVFFAVIMTVGTLGLLHVASDRWGEPVALTMTFTTFVLFQMFNVFNARTERESVFSRKLFANPRLLAAVAVVVVLQVLAVTWEPLQRLFGTEDLTVVQSAWCVAVASTVVWLEELRKLGARLLVRWRS